MKDDLVEAAARANLERWSKLAESDLGIFSDNSNPEDMGSRRADWDKMTTAERAPWLAAAQADVALIRPAIRREALEEAVKWHEQQAYKASNSLHCGSENREYHAAREALRFHREAAADIRALGEK